MRTASVRFFQEEPHTHKEPSAGKAAFLTNENRPVLCARIYTVAVVQCRPFRKKKRSNKEFETILKYICRLLAFCREMVRNLPHLRSAR